MTTEVSADAAEDRPAVGDGAADDPIATTSTSTGRPDAGTKPWRRRLLTVLLPLLVYSGVAGAYFKPTLLDGLTYGQVDDMQRVYFPWVGLQGFPTDTVFPQQDYPNSYFPRQVWLERSLRDGELPEWNPYSFAGSPFLDNGAGITFHPVRALLTFTVSPALAHDLYLLLAMLTAGLGTHALARRLGSSHAAAYLAGTAYMLNATFLAWSQLELMAAIVAGLPWALYGLRRWSDVAVAGDGRSRGRGGLRWVVFAGVVCGLMPLGGSIDFTLTAWLACGLYAVALTQRGLGRTRQFRERLHWRRVAAPATFTAVSVALGAPALLPFVSLSAYVGRKPQDPAVFESAILLPVQRFLHTFWPPQDPVTSVLMHEMSFAGTLVAVLALVGLLRRGPRATLGRVLLLGAFLFVANTVVSRAASDLIPTYRSFTVGRQLFFWNLGLALLASVGLDGLFAAGRWVAGRVGRRGRLDRPAHLGGFGRVGRPGVALAVLVATVAVVVNTYQLGTYGRSINPRFSPRAPAELMPVTPAIEALQAVDGGLGGGRFLPVRFDDGAPVMSASLSMIFDLESGAGYESTFLSGVEATWRTVAGEDLETVLANPMTLGYQAGFTLEEIRTDLLARVGVTTLLLPPGAADRPIWGEVLRETGGLEQAYAGPDGEVWTLRDAPPRAAVVPRAEVAADVPTVLRRVFADDFPWRSRVVLSPEPVTGREPQVAKGVAVDPAAPDEGPGAGYADEERYDNDEIRLAVWAPKPSYLVLRDSWAPGWTATVGGQDVPVELANGAYRAVPVPAGDSVVVFRYRTPGLRLGFGLSAIALAAMSAGAVWMIWTDVVRPVRRRR